MAIEINGLFYHTIGNQFTTKYPTYHQEKALRCRESNLTLLQFTDQEIYDKERIVVSMIKSRLGMNQKIGARKCTINEIKGSEAKRFLEENHLDGWVASRIYLGALHNGTLVSVMSFSPSRFEKGKWEIIRFASKNGLTITGIGGRFLKKFFLENPKSILTTYANLMHGDGESYVKMGFTDKGITKPGYKWMKDNNLYSRQKFQKHKLEALLENFNPEETEEENMFRHGYMKYYDAGHRRFEMENPYASNEL